VNILLFQIVHFAWRAAGWGRFGADLPVGASWGVWVAAMSLVVAVAHGSHRGLERPARAWLRRRAPRRLLAGRADPHPTLPPSPRGAIGASR
jgi:peptidoglycan/LPS O-acetylase OafA/YrhL